MPWYGWALVIVVGLAIGYIVLKRKNPAAATVVSVDAAHVASTISSTLSSEFVKLRALLESKIAATPAAANAVAAEPVPPAAPGKSGTPGTFTLQVTGDPKVDLPALTAAYLG
jgi:hypothetical protein